MADRGGPAVSPRRATIRANRAAARASVRDPDTEKGEGLPSCEKDQLSEPKEHWCSLATPTVRFSTADVIPSPGFLKFQRLTTSSADAMAVAERARRRARSPSRSGRRRAVEPDVTLAGDAEGRRRRQEKRRERGPWESKAWRADERRCAPASRYVVSAAAARSDIGRLSRPDRPRAATCTPRSAARPRVRRRR